MTDRNQQNGRRIIGRLWSAEQAMDVWCRDWSNDNNKNGLDDDNDHNNYNDGDDDDDYDDEKEKQESNRFRSLEDIEETDEEYLPLVFVVEEGEEDKGAANHPSNKNKNDSSSSPPLVLAYVTADTGALDEAQWILPPPKTGDDDDDDDDDDDSDDEEDEPPQEQQQHLLRSRRYHKYRHRPLVEHTYYGYTYVVGRVRNPSPVQLKTIRHVTDLVLLGAYRPIMHHPNITQQRITNHDNDNDNDNGTVVRTLTNNKAPPAFPFHVIRLRKERQQQEHESPSPLRIQERQLTLTNSDMTATAAATTTKTKPTTTQRRRQQRKEEDTQPNVVVKEEGEQESHAPSSWSQSLIFTRDTSWTMQVEERSAVATVAVATEGDNHNNSNHDFLELGTLWSSTESAVEAWKEGSLVSVYEDDEEESDEEEDDEESESDSDSEDDNDNDSDESSSIDQDEIVRLLLRCPIPVANNNSNNQNTTTSLVYASVDTEGKVEDVGRIPIPPPSASTTDDNNNPPHSSWTQHSIMIPAYLGQAFVFGLLPTTVQSSSSSKKKKKNRNKQPQQQQQRPPQGDNHQDEEDKRWLRKQIKTVEDLQVLGAYRPERYSAYWAKGDEHDFPCHVVTLHPPAPSSSQSQSTSHNSNSNDQQLQQQQPSQWTIHVQEVMEMQDLDLIDTVQEKQYELTYDFCDWPIYLERQCSLHHDETKRQFFRQDLQYAINHLPDHAIACLKNTGNNNNNNNNGKPCAIYINESFQYGPSQYPYDCDHVEYHEQEGDQIVQYYQTYKLHAAKDKCIEIYNLEEYMNGRPPLRGMGALLLHELAHAYHDRDIGDGAGDELIASCYQQAMKEGLYNHVPYRVWVNDEDDDDDTASREHKPVKYVHGRAYACKTYSEYFSELSAAFLGGIHNEDTEKYHRTFPHNRSQIQQHDPRGYAMLQQLWKIPNPSSDTDRP